MKKNINRFWSAVVLMVMIAALFAGCGSTDHPGDDSAMQGDGETVIQDGGEPDNGDDGESAVTDGGDAAQDGTQTEIPQVTEVTVNSMEGLVEAIAPDTKIILEPGYYILSEFLDEVWAEQGEMWNVKHPYVQIRECYDGLELLIQNVEHLSVSGGAEDCIETEIATEPRYSTVLNFYQCSDVELSGITIGHTGFVSCEGNVLDFYACDDVIMNNMDIYGCGLYGIGAMDSCGDITVTDSFIRDCSDGSLWLDGGTGTYEFINCSLVGSWGGGCYFESGTSALRFVNCEFGEGETNTWYFFENIDTVDCVWSEITQYPDYSG